MKLRLSGSVLPGAIVLLTIFACALIISTFTVPVGVSAQEDTKQQDKGNVSALAPTAVFPANAGTLGAIPDTGTGCGDYVGATPIDVTFTVSGISGTITDVRLSTTFSPAHTWRGDLWLELRAPSGAPAKTIFKQTGSTTAAGCGSANDAAGPYVFFDTAAPAATWWLTAGTPTPAGNYKASTPGGVAGGGADTTITPTFAGLGAAANGTWTLRILDGGGGDTGSISAASLEITTAAAAPAQHVVDYDGDGKTDFSVVRNTGGGPTGQVTWFNQNNGSGAVSGFAWGIATDFFVPEDYDGDNKTDIAVWRPGAATSAVFYILNSTGFTLSQVTFGQTGDDPSVVGDYDGDGKADVAVYRSGAAPGNPSTWFYRGTLSNPGGNVTFAPWGQNGDFPAPGDYDGNGSADFCVQRNNGGGQAAFWTRLSTGVISPLVVFGTPTDVIVPGDYDGDGKTDIATVRGSGGAILWFVLPSSTGIVSAAPFAIFGGSATDFPAQGDYDGDGKTDVAVWRPNADPTMCFFYYRGSTSGAAQSEWGANGDYPVANFNSH